MQMLIEFLPIILFFVVYKFLGIYMATLAAIVTTLAQVGWSYSRGKKPELMTLITLGLVVILGSLTLYLENELFIKWKPTAVYWALATTFLVSQYALKTNLIKKMLSKNLEVTESVWTQLNLSWSMFFIVMGIINLVVVYNFDTDTWVNFKLFGTLVLTAIFVIIQAVFLAKHLPQDKG